ncbi:hypothetical protein N2152v2_002753 [Parachlorella kessleri]
MVRTRGAATFQQQFPLFHALITGDASRVAPVCTRQEAAKCGPGNLSATMLAVLLDTPSPAFQKLASRAPLEARLSLGASDSDLHNWLDLAQVTDSAALRQQLVAGRTALDLALALGRAEHATALIAAGASLQPLLPEDGQYDVPAAVPRTLWDQLSHHALTHYSGRRLARAPAALLPQLAQLALLAGQPTACLEVLQSAQLPGRELSGWDALTVVAQATVRGHLAIASHVIQCNVTGLLLPLLAQYSSLDRRVMHVLVPHLAQRVGRALLSNLLVKAAGDGEHEACATVLEVVTEQGLPLCFEHCRDVFQAFVRHDCPAQLAKLLLAASAALSPSQLMRLAGVAIQQDREALLEVLLAAGAPQSAELALEAVDCLACSCVAALLRRGPLPIDSAVPFQAIGSTALLYFHPILRILQTLQPRRSSKWWTLDSEMPQELRMLQLLLGAGHRPPVYHNIVVPPDPQLKAVFDPLRDRPQDFPTKQGNRSWLWLALNHPDWSRSNHREHPRAIKRAFETVLLAAARAKSERPAGRVVSIAAEAGRTGSTVEEQGGDMPERKRQRLIATAGPGSDGSSCAHSATRLAALPTDVLLHVLGLAARPLSAWVVLDAEL